MSRIKTALLSLALAAGLIAAPLALADTSYAAPADDIKTGVDAVGGNDAGGDNIGESIKTIVNMMLYILGAIAVVMIVIGGIRYAISQGNQQQLESAKNTILYAVIGLIVAIMAYAIVNFVLDAFTK